MEDSGFDVGQHVVVELEGGKTIAGHLLGSNDHGWLIKVTHKLKENPKVLPDGAEDEIDRILREETNLSLKAMLWKNKVAGWLRMDREEMIEILTELVKQDVLDSAPVTHTLKELLSPITTFFNGGIVDSMEVTGDRNTDALLNNLDFDFDPEAEDEEPASKG